jgi:hypothetical protein
MSSDLDSKGLNLVNEKPLQGEMHFVLRLLATEDRQRMCLVMSDPGQHLEFVFAGPLNTILDSDAVKKFYSMIHSQEQFHSISSQIRSVLEETIKSR